MIISCLECGNEFRVGLSDYNKGQRCCSRECSKIHHRKNGKLKKFKCLVCGKEMEGIPDKKHLFKYCSRECYYKGRLLNHEQLSEAYVIRGYRWIYVNGYPVREHIYIMEQSLGRKLKEDEVIHHINFNRSDNRLENLKLMTRADHSGLHAKIRPKLRNEKGKFIKSNKGA